MPISRARAGHVFGVWGLVRARYRFLVAGFLVLVSRGVQVVGFWVLDLGFLLSYRDYGDGVDRVFQSHQAPEHRGQVVDQRRDTLRLRFGVWGLGFGVWSLGCGGWGVGLGVWGLRMVV